MIRITIRELGFGAAGLAALGGCAAEPAQAIDDGLEVGATSSAWTVAAAGSAELELGWAYDGNGQSYALQVRNSTTDEFLRVGETLSFAVPGWVMWNALYPNEAAPEGARLKQLRVRARAIFLRGGAQVATRTVTSRTFTGDSFYDVMARTGTFVAPRNADAMKLELQVSDTRGGSRRVTLGAEQTALVALLGAALPDKTALFDNDHGTLRQRVLEGGAPVQGAETLLAYTDWRANTLVDSSAIDRQIGRSIGHGRFGEYSYPIYGDLQHEVSAGVAFDDGRGWAPEVQLAANTASVLLGAGRTSFETPLTAPAAATRMSVYFHVRTYLVADYSRFPGTNERRYAQGERVLVRERWDNPAGPSSNYEFHLETVDPARPGVEAR